MQSEQNESPSGRRGGDTQVPPNTEEDEDIIISSVNSGTDGGNSDIGVLADFSDDEEESEVEQLSGCRIPCCQCEGRIEYMEWGSDDMTETDDSEYEDSDERAIRLNVENDNYDLPEGMTPEIYTPPLRKNWRRRYEVWKKKEPEIEEYISGTSDRGFQTDKESPNSGLTVQPRMVADDDIPTVGDKNDDRGRWGRTGSDTDTSGNEESNLFGRPVTESATAWAGRDSHGPSDESGENSGRPVTDAMTEMAGNDANISGVDYSDLVDQLVRETMRAWAESGEPLGCRIPGCKCDGRIEDMEWGSVDMTDNSEYDDPDDRATRLYEESCNYDLSEGMTPRTDTPPLRLKNNGQELQESTSCASELESQTDDEELLNSELTVQPGTVADGDIPTHGDEGDSYGPNELTGWTGCDADSTSGELSEIIDRPVTESVTAQLEMDTVFPSSEHSELVSRPVTTDGQVSLGDTPPSSDSGIHSLEEQWENMSISAVDLESEQNERPTSGSPTGRRGSDTRVPPNTEEEEDINFPWMGCLLEGESDELSSIDRPNYRKDIQYHCASSVTDGGNSDTGVLSDISDYEYEETPEWEQAFQQTMDADEDIPSCRDKKDNLGSQKQAGNDTDFPNGEYSEFVNIPVMGLVTAQTESNTDFPSEEDSEFFGRPVTEPVSSWAGRDTDLHSDEHSEIFGRPVTNLVTAWVGSDTDHPSGEHLKFSNRPVTESVTARETDTEEPLVMNVSTVSIELSELRTRVLSDTDTSGIPVYEECCTPECRNPVIVLPDAHAQLAISDIQWNSKDCCFGVCKKADSVN